MKEKGLGGAVEVGGVGTVEVEGGAAAPEVVGTMGMGVRGVNQLPTSSDQMWQCWSLPCLAAMSA